MESNQMFHVTMGQTARDYPAGTTFQTIADQVQGDYPHRQRRGGVESGLGRIYADKTEKKLKNKKKNKNYKEK